MANLAGYLPPDFDAHDDAYDAMDFAPLPEGEYTAQITESELKPNSANTGHVLKIVWQIIEGEHEKRLFFQFLNINNPNQKAMQIARRDLAQICRAVNLPRPQDTQELHGRPAILYLAIKQDAEGRMRNECKSVAPYGAPAAKPASTPPQHPKAASVPQNGAQPPWKR